MSNDPLGLMSGGDPLGLMNESDPLGLNTKEKPEERSYAGRVIKEGLPAVANTAEDILYSIPSGMRGLAEGAGALAGGASFEEAMGQGMEGFQNNMESLQGNLPRFRDPRVQEAQGALNEGLDTLMQGGGRTAETAATDMNAWTPGANAFGDLLGLPKPQPQMAPGVQTLGEVVTNLAPIPGAEALRRGVSRIPKVGSTARAARAATEAAAQDMLSQKMAGEAEYGSWEAYDAERQAYMKALEDLDNAIVKYPKDLQAPQLGGGGKVARIEDQVGKREKGEFTSQMAFDEEMRKLGEEQGKEKPVQVPYAGEQYEPVFGGDIREYAPKPVRPYQIEPLREKRISEGEATKIYLKPAFQRTLEEKLKLRHYEESLRQAKTGGVERPLDELGAVKEPGGMWNPETIDRVSGEMARHLRGIHPALPRMGDTWSRNAIQRYLNKYAGTTRDPLKNIEIPYGNGTARWEDITDSAINSERADLATKPNTQGGYNYFSDDPNVKPDEPIYGIRGPQSFSDRTPLDSVAAVQAFQSYLNHVGDYLQQHVRSDDLARYDLVRAVKETKRWDEQLAKKMNEQRKDAMKGMEIVKDYGDGFKWVKLNKPGQFAAESDMMGHSVRGYEPAKRLSFRTGGELGDYLSRGGKLEDTNRPHPDWVEAAGEDGHPNYGLGGWDAIKRGDAEIYSLRDKNGQAHVTIEVAAKYGHRTEDLPPDLLDRARNGEDISAEMEQRGLNRQSIIQIKGKQNRAPNKEYLKYVQDFVKSKDWAAVGDAHHTGMRPLAERMMEDGVLNSDRPIADKVYRHFIKDDDFRKDITSWGDKLVTDDEWQRFIINDVPGETMGAGGYNQRLYELQEQHLVKPYDDLPSSPPADAFDNVQMVRPSTFRDQLEAIRDYSSDEWARKVSELLLTDKEFNPRFKAETPKSGNDGSYSPNEYTIYLRPDKLGDERLVIHEAVHARTHSAIEGALRNLDYYQNVKPAVRRLQDLYINFKDIWGQKYATTEQGYRLIENIGGEALTEHGLAPYGLKNIHEFVAEAFSNPEFQRFLQNHEVPKGIASNFFKNYWDMFVEAIGKILGFSSKDHNFLSETIKAGADIMHGADKDMRMTFNQIEPSWEDVGGYSYGDFKKDLESKGLKLSDAQTRAMYNAQQPAEVKRPAHPDAKAVETIKQIPGLEKVQQQYADTRTWEEVLPEIQKAKDVSILKANATAKIIQGKFTASEHPLWSWTSSQIHWIKHNALDKANKKLHGTDRRNPEPGTYNHQWKLLTGKEREEVRAVGWEFNNHDGRVTTAELQNYAQKTFGHPLNPRQIKAYQDRVRINKEVLADINKVLEANGKQPIHELPNYFSPNVFNGPYLTKFIDSKTGDTVKIHSSYTRPSLAKMQKLAPEMKVETIEIGNKGHLDFDQIEWVLRQLHKEMRDPAARGIAEGLRRQGFMKHGLKRRGVEGGEGSAPGSLRKYEETTEQYIRGAYEYISNRELDSLYNKILDEKSIDGQPHAKGYALEAIDTARGGGHAAFEDFSKVLANIFRGGVQIGTAGKVRLPERALKDFVRLNSKIGTSLLLAFGHVPMIGAQLLQHTYAAPKMMAEFAKMGRNPALVMKIMAKSYKDLGKWDNHPDIIKLREVGALDPTFKYDWSTYASESDPRFKQRMSDHLTGISLLSYLEANAVRRPASLMFLNMLRELGYKGDDIYYVAKEMTDQYMVSTKWYEKPHMFSRTGLVGQTLGPLQSFSTTWAGMMREFTRLSASGLLEGSIAKQMPLAAFMAINLTTAGLLGLVGVKEWDAVATWLNKTFGYNIPTGTEYILSHAKSDISRFGVLSDAVGMHVGSTFAAPTMTGSFALPLQNMYNAARGIGRVGQQVGSMLGLNQPPTSVEMREALKGVAPRSTWGFIEKAETPEGRPYQDSAGNAGPVTRDSKDWLARYLSTYSNKEVKEKNRNYVMKQEAAQRSQRLSSTLNKAIDQMLMDPQRARQTVPVMLKELMQTGQYSSQDINSGLKRELMSKILESDIKSMGKGRTPKQLMMIQLYQQLQ